MRDPADATPGPDPESPADRDLRRLFAATTAADRMIGLIRGREWSDDDAQRLASDATVRAGVEQAFGGVQALAVAIAAHLERNELGGLQPQSPAAVVHDFGESLADLMAGLPTSRELARRVARDSAVRLAVVYATVALRQMHDALPAETARADRDVDAGEGGP